MTLGFLNNRVTILMPIVLAAAIAACGDPPLDLRGFPCLFPSVTSLTLQQGSSGPLTVKRAVGSPCPSRTAPITFGIAPGGDLIVGISSVNDSTTLITARGSGTTNVFAKLGDDQGGAVYVPVIVTQ